VNARTLSINSGDTVLVTGGAGFIGSAIVRALLARGCDVRVLEPERATPNLDELDVELFYGDVRDAARVGQAMDGVRLCVHAAALYGFWPRDPALYYAINVEGSRNVLAAAEAAGVERTCYTSTVATIGLQRSHEGDGAVEDDYAHIEHLYGPYKRTKYVAEHEVLRMGAQGAPVVLVHPTFPLGPGDERPTPTGKVVLDFLLGKMPGYVETSFNIEHVDDLAQGHLLALEFGRQGVSYICGGENVAMPEMLSMLSTITGLPFSNRKVPGALAIAAGLVADTVQGRLLKREPSVPLEGARMSTSLTRFDDSRARVELGYRSRPADATLRAAVEWFLATKMAEGSRASTAASTLGSVHQG
jgi:dihydroflavonol-4-reductase